MIDFLLALTALVDKFLWAGFVFSILGVLRVVYLFYAAFNSKPPQQLVLDKKEIIAVGIYISVIIMSIFTGIRL